MRGTGLQPLTSNNMARPIRHLSPASLSGFKVCPLATAGCKHACLNTAGRGGIARGGILTYRDVARGRRNEIQEARRLRTRAFFEHRTEFMGLLTREIVKACTRARKLGYTPVFRLNGTRDIRWETMRAGGPGGQHVNRTESAVRVTHLPTGVQATAMEERSQHRNRKLALARLMQKLNQMDAKRFRDARNERWRAHQQLQRGNPVRLLQPEER